MPVLINMRPDEEVEPLLPDHLRDLMKANQRPKSIRERRLTLLRIGRWLGHPVETVTRDELVAWQTWCLERTSSKPLTQASMHNAIVHVSCYMKWLNDKQHRADNPVGALIRPRHVHQSMPKPMDDADVRRALSSADQPLHAWVSLGAFCGLRCMEIATLARENIVDGAKPYLRITGKGGKERTVTLPAALRDELLRDFPGCGYLFERMDGRAGPPTAMRVSERLNDYLHSVGVAGTAHTLRHRFGTKLYADTGDLLIVAEVMGHASIETTRGYVQLVGDKASAAIERISHLAA